MVPAGDATPKAVDDLARLMAAGDTIIDGGNRSGRTTSPAPRRCAQGIHYLDVGTSGGVWGLERGYCLMIGGEKQIVERLDPIFRALSARRGRHPADAASRGERSPPRAGLHPCRPERRRAFREDDPQRHRVRADAGLCGGLRYLEARGRRSLPAEHRLDLNLADIAETWRRGSVVTSWLLDLTAAALAEEGDLASYSGHVADSAKAAGPSRPRSRKRCRPMCSRRRSTPASARGRSTPSRRKFCPRCAKASAAIRSPNSAEGEPVFGPDHAQRKLMRRPARRHRGDGCVRRRQIHRRQTDRCRLGCPFRDADSFHPPANIEKMSRGAPLTDDDRWPWLRAIAAWIGEHRAAGTTCVVTCSALKRVYRDIVTDQAKRRRACRLSEGRFRPDRSAA